MAQDETTELQRLIDRMRGGDDAARRDLVGHAYERLRRLAKRIFHRDFPRLEKFHDTGSVVDEAVVRLLKALDQVDVSTVRDFFKFSAAKIRYVLLDMARRDKRTNARQVGRPQSDSQNDAGSLEPADTTDDPAKLMIWAEFHRKVEELPDDERDVVDLYWYQGLSQADIAQLLDIGAKEISRRWLRAVRRLKAFVPGLELEALDSE